MKKEIKKNKLGIRKALGLLACLVAGTISACNTLPKQLTKEDFAQRINTISTSNGDFHFGEYSNLNTFALIKYNTFYREGLEQYFSIINQYVLHDWDKNGISAGDSLDSVFWTFETSEDALSMNASDIYENYLPTSSHSTHYDVQSNNSIAIHEVTRFPGDSKPFVTNTVLKGKDAKNTLGALNNLYERFCERADSTSN